MRNEYSLLTSAILLLIQCKLISEVRIWTKFDPFFDSLLTFRAHCTLSLLESHERWNMQKEPRSCILMDFYFLSSRPLQANESGWLSNHELFSFLSWFQISRVFLFVSFFIEEFGCLHVVVLPKAKHISNLTFHFLIRSDFNVLTKKSKKISFNKDKQKCTKPENHCRRPALAALFFSACSFSLSSLMAPTVPNITLAGWMEQKWKEKKKTRNANETREHQS